MRLRGPLALAAAAVVAAAPAAFSAAAPLLVGTVGPGYTIDLEDAAGARVTKLDPGTYEFEVRDLSDEHNFRLTGPGVSQATGVDGTGTVRWTVALRDGVYAILCDPHETDMRRTFVVGTPAAAPAQPGAARATRLLATVGPGRTITLRSAGGAVLKRLEPGPYAITVRDRSKAHNFHLVGPGVNRRTGVAAVGTSTWRVTLAAGTLRFYSDRAPKTLRGSLPVR